MSEQHYLVIDIDDPEKNGLYRDFESIAKAPFPHFIEKEGTPIKFRPVRASDAQDGAPWVDTNTALAEIHATVGLPGNVLAEAETADFSTEGGGVVSVVNIQTGTSTKRSIQRVTIDTHLLPTDGDIIINFSSPEITRIGVVSNRGVAQVINAAFGQPDTAGDKYLTFDDLYDLAGPVRVFFDNGGGGAPPVPAGGRNLRVVYANGATAATLATLTVAVLNADAKWTAVITPGAPAEFKATSVNRGPRTAPTVGTGTTGITWTVITAGVAGAMSGKALQLSDKDGTVGVWFKIGSALPPDVADDATRTLAVTLTDDDTEATVATATSSAINADAEFVATVLAGTNTVEVTDAVGGERTNAAALTSPCSITISQNGKALTYAGPFTEDVAVIEAAFNSYFTVTRRTNGDLTFKAQALGAQPALTVDASDLEFPNVLLALLQLNTPEMAAYFAAAILLDPDLEYLNLEYELKLQLVGQDLYTVLRMAVRVYLTIFDGGATPVPFTPGPSPLLSFVDYTGGGATKLDGVATTGLSVPQIIVFLHPSAGLCIYILVAGTDIEASPGIIRPDDYAAVTNEKVWKSGI